jgi:integrase
MPQRTKGARLWLRPAYRDDKSVWLIRDGDKRISTRCGPPERAEAERQLADYLAKKYRPARERGRDPDQIPVADVLNIYIADRANDIRSPAELGRRVEALLGFWGRMTLADVNGARCRAYARQRGSESMARRELEDLRAAINHHRKEGLCNAVVEIVLPDRSPSRERWLTRSEAARLLWAAWRYREIQKGIKTDRRSRQHVARFILVALYTGTRSTAVCSAALTQAIGRGHVDLDTGVFARRAFGVKETKKRQPSIRIPERLLAHMRRWARIGVSRSSIVEFDGHPVKSVRKAFARAAKDAGLSGVTPHVLRHTAVTWAMQARADPYAAADFFGMTLEVLERVYGHHHPDHHKGVGDALTGRGRAVSGQFQRNKT